MEIFIELTHKEHGGEGWDFGEYLWSPIASSWDNIMAMPQPGDLILHSLKLNPHHFVGYSFVENAAIAVDEKPPIESKWSKKYSKFYKIKLTNYTPLEHKKNVMEFLRLYKDDLIPLGINYSFYALQKAETPNEHLTVAQKYLAKVPKEVYQLVIEFINTVILPQSIVVSEEDDLPVLMDANDGRGNPERVVVMTSRISRLTKIIRDLKEEQDNTCQICGLKMELESGHYSEGHHLQPLGNTHRGPDVVGNVVILCPNHHVEFDKGVIAIDPATKLIKHLNTLNSHHNKPLAYTRTNLDDKYLEYHFKKIFKLNK